MTSIATLQTEREKLRAIQAKTQFEDAFAATVAKQELVAAALACRDAMTCIIDGLADRLMQAIGTETDETRVHYLMTDAAHDALTEAGTAVESASSKLPTLGERIKRGAKPRDLLTVSEWSDRNRWIRSGTNAPGQWKTALTPYLREIMDSLSEHSPVRSVSFIKASGLGGTEALNNWLGYIMAHLQNKDTLVVMPTLELRDRSFNPRLAKMLEESPALADLVTTASRNKANRGDLLEYGARARIIKAGANSPDSLRSDHLPYVICDEVDAFPWDVGGEGDPMTLIENRQRTYTRAKSYYVSTPTTAGQSRIDLLYSRSDRRRYHVPCPHCGDLQALEWANFKYRLAPPVDGEESAAPQVIRAWIVCKHCGAEIDEGHKTDMLSAGRWIPERPQIKLHRGYHLNTLYAPIGLGLSWKQIAEKWLQCQGDTAELKAFINTYLGEVWQEQGDNIESVSLITRLENYQPQDLPPVVVSAGCDVQKDRIEASIVAWGDNDEAWLLDHIIVPGDTTQDEAWAALDDELSAAGVQVAVIDSGYNTSMVYDFCASRAWAIPGKGVTGTGRPLVEDERRRKQRLRQRRRRGNAVEPIGVDQGKALIYANLKKTATGPGYIHFPNTAAFDEEYFAQLAAERLVTKVKGHRPFLEWVKTRPRNEALDCLVYAMAARRLTNASPRVIDSTCTRLDDEEHQAPNQRSTPAPVAKAASDDDIFSPIKIR